jgi:hypothetical protein
MNFSDMELPSNRAIGLLFSVICTVSSALLCFNEATELGFIFLLLALGFLGVSLIRPRILLPLNKLWMRFGVVLGMIVSPVVLGVLFFGIFTPVGLLLRLFGRDELRLKLKGTLSYWKVRESGVVSSDSFKNQF